MLLSKPQCLYLAQPTHPPDSTGEASRSWPEKSLGFRLLDSCQTATSVTIL